MKKNLKLSPKERDFFRLVDRAAFNNPFTRERKEVYKLICKHEPGDESSQTSDRVHMRNFAIKIHRKIHRMRQEDRARIDQYSGDEDQTLVKSIQLFDVFNRHVPFFDRIIAEQIEYGERPLPGPYGAPIVSELIEAGLPEDEAAELFAFFYQLQRTYTFIRQKLVGNSSCMRTLQGQLWDTVFTYDSRRFGTKLWDRMEDFSTMLLGETGTGKNAAATAIGYSNVISYDIKKQQFTESFLDNYISINLSQYPESLIESELFGHRKGAFTGAVNDYEGLFAQCRPHGIIFLDEIGDVSIHVQMKLLQILQDRKFTPVGSREYKRFQGRVLAATNRDINALRQEGTIRNDFYYRICSDIITLPPLRVRIAEDPEELYRLVDNIINRIQGIPDPEMARMITGFFEKNLGPGYPWQGNVRELEQAVRRVILTANYQGETLVNKEGISGLANAMENGSLTAKELLGGYCAHLYRTLGTFEAVAKQTGLDRRTAKKYVLEGENPES